MKKVKTFLALSIFLAAVALPVIEVHSQTGDYVMCFFGKSGEEGTWTEGACIEHPLEIECQKCFLWVE